MRWMTLTNRTQLIPRSFKLKLGDHFIILFVGVFSIPLVECFGKILKHFENHVPDFFPQQYRETKQKKQPPRKSMTWLWEWEMWQILTWSWLNWRRDWQQKPSWPWIVHGEFQHLGPKFTVFVEQTQGLTMVVSCGKSIGNLVAKVRKPVICQVGAIW